MKKKIISLMLVIFMISSLFIGCGKQEEKDTSKDKSDEVVDKNDKEDKKETYKWIDPVTNFQTLRDEVKITLDTGLPAYLNFMPYPADFPLMEMKVKAVQKRHEPYMVQRFPTTVRYTDTEMERVTLLETDIKNYVEQMIVKFITGDETIDNFDKFVKTLNEIELEELLKLKQGAYDRWAKK
ncbi:type 2 periplasmic-binding domain-containing protein [Xylanivirga thermophila]|uniref:hypothetical protein n=1 Tax=Xylanivirga thermophila TaxID=2496273 RepID=UPI00101DB6CC|nr:hypothetical protein [Xylanivirga thermophila]